MIPKEKTIEQSMIQSCKYRDSLLKEKNRTTGQFVGIPLTHNQIESQATGFLTGFESGVSFAETELQTIAIEFAEWCCKNEYAIVQTDIDKWEWWKWDGSVVTELFSTTTLFVKFLSERTAQ